MANFDAGMPGGATLRFTINQSSQSIPGNTSTDSWSLTLFKGYSSWTATPIGWYVQVNGTAYSGTYTFDFSGGATSKLIASGSTVVGHNSDGTKTTNCGGYTADTGTSTGGPATAGGNFVQTTIPRASTPTFELVSAPGVLVTTANSGVAIKINTNRASSGFTHTLEYTLGSVVLGSIATGVGADYASWTIPLSLMNEIPSALSGIITITTKTYSGATLIGTKTTPLTMTVPSGIEPDFTTVTNVEATPGLAANVGAYVQYLTTLALAITGAVGAYSSTITSYKIEVAGQTINLASGTTPAALALSGTYNIVGTVTDSRGRTKSKNVSITVLAYTPPALTAITTQRALVSGVVDDNGTYIRVNINAAVQSLIVAAAQKNAIVYKIYTRAHGPGAWTLKKTVTPGGITFNSYDLVSTYAISSSFDVLVEVLDDFSTSSVQTTIATSVIFQHWDAALGVGIGKYRTNGMLDVQGDIYTGGNIVIDASDLATTTLAGISEMATDAEAVAASSTAVSVTPSNLAAKAASNAEALAGTLTTKFPTPAALAYYMTLVICRLTKTTAQNTSGTTGAGGILPILFDVDTIDTHNAHSTVTNTGRITPPRAGYYLFTAGARSAQTSGFMTIQFMKNGTSDGSTASYMHHDGATSTVPMVKSEFVVYMNGTTDYVEIGVYSSVATQALQTGNCFLEAIWLSN